MHVVVLNVCKLNLSRIENSAKAFTDAQATYHTVPGAEGQTEAATDISVQKEQKNEVGGSEPQEEGH